MQRASLGKESFHSQERMGVTGGLSSNFNNDFGSQAGFSHRSPSILFSSPSCSDQQGQCISDQTICTRLDSKRSNKRDRGSNCGGSPILLRNVHSTEGQNVGPSYYKPKIVKQISVSSVIQDGDGTQDCPKYLECQMGLQDRPQGRLFPCPDCMGISEVFCVCNRREDVCVSVHAIRPSSSALGVFEGDQTAKGLPSHTEDDCPLFLGRFPAFSRHTGETQTSDLNGSEYVQEVGSQSELEEVFNFSSSGSGISGSSFQTRYSSTSSSGGESSEDCSSDSSDGYDSESNEERSGRAVGSPELCFFPGSVGEATSSASANMDELPDGSRDEGLSGGSSVPVSIRLALLDKQELASLAGFHEDPSSHTPADDRCIRTRVGGSVPSSQSVGTVAPGAAGGVNQLVRASSDFSFSGLFQGGIERQSSATFNGQHDSSLLYNEAGNAQIPDFDGFDDENTRDVLARRYNSSSKAPARLPEHFSGYGVQIGSNIVGMGSRLGDMEVRMGEADAAEGRACGLVRQQVQQEIEQVRLSFPGPSSPGYQCPFGSVGPVGSNLSLPSNWCHGGSYGSASSVQRQGCSNSTLVQGSSMVYQSAGQIFGTHSVTSFFNSFARNVQGNSVPPTAFVISASRVETMKWALLRMGYSAQATITIINCEKPSTRRQYQSNWKNFLLYLAAQGFSHADISRPIVTDFLEFYSTEMLRQYRTISVYKAALVYPLKWACGIHLEDLDITARFMRGVFNNNPPDSAAPMPEWSINVVLRFLRSHYFEPLDTVVPMRLTQKVIFLTLLASGRRKGEIANLSRIFVQGVNDLGLTWMSGFKPKRCSPDFHPASPSVSRMSSIRAEDDFQCPIRALNIYIERSKAWLDTVAVEYRPRNLFLVPGSPKPISDDLISKLFVGLIKDAYKLMGGVDTLMRVNTADLDHPIGIHQMRKLAATYAWKVGRSEELVREKLGFYSLRILKKNYIAEAPELREACVLPGGAFIPNRDHEMSDSE